MPIETGRLKNKAHLYPVRVYYEDTDAGGIVYHARYLHFAERARTEMLRCMGLPHSELTATYGVIIIVRGLEAQYVKPARLDDALEVRTKLLDLGAASIKMSQLIGFMGGEEAENAKNISARLVVKLAAVNMHGRPTRLPGVFMEKAKDLLEQDL
jgi:acyl-CoA thioester hydrolase